MENCKTRDYYGNHMDSDLLPALRGLTIGIYKLIPNRIKQ